MLNPSCNTNPTQCILGNLRNFPRESLPPYESQEGIRPDKNLVDKNLADKNLADKNLADKNLADKNLADKNLADKIVADKSLADKKVADKSYNLCCLHLVSSSCIVFPFSFVSLLFVHLPVLKSPALRLPVLKSSAL